jgi:hypothetical protein
MSYFKSDSIESELINDIQTKIFEESEVVELILNDLSYRFYDDDFNKKVFYFVKKSERICRSNTNFIQRVTLYHDGKVNDFNMLNAIKTYNYDLIEEYLNNEFENLYHDISSVKEHGIELELLLDIEILAEIIVSSFVKYASELSSANFEADNKVLH